MCSALITGATWKELSTSVSTGKAAISITIIGILPTGYFTDAHCCLLLPVMKASFLQLLCIMTYPPSPITWNAAGVAKIQLSCR